MAIYIYIYIWLYIYIYIYGWTNIWIPLVLSMCGNRCFSNIRQAIALTAWNIHNFKLKKICLNSFFNLFMFSSKSALGMVGGFRGSSVDCLQLLR